MAPRLTRRDFIVSGAAATIVGGSAACLPEVDGDWPGEGPAVCSWTEPRITLGDPAQAGRVAEVYDPDLAIKGKPLADEKRAAEDINKLLLQLTGKVDVKAAWGLLLAKMMPGEVVGIKVNTLNAKVPTQPAVVKALVDSLKTGGLAAEQILVWDRRLDELTKAGFTDKTMGVKVEGTLDAPLTKGGSRGYESGTVCVGGWKTHLSNILTRRIRHLINVAVMKRHSESGFTGCMKNHYGTIDNPGDFHDKKNKALVVVEKRFERVIPSINALSEVAGITRLWMVDATIGVCKGGTEDSADCIPNRLLMGLDPVAIDVRAGQIRDEQRGSLGADSETISKDWLAAAERMGLGKQKIIKELVK